MNNRKTKLKLTDFECNLLGGRNERVPKQSLLGRSLIYRAFPAIRLP